MLVLWEEISVSWSDLGNNSEVVFFFCFVFYGLPISFFLFLFPADGWYFWKLIFFFNLPVCLCYPGDF